MSLLVLLDAPSPSYSESCDSLTRKLSYLGYVLKRAKRLGLRTSLVYLHQHLHKRFVRTSQSARTEIRVAMLNAAVLAYQPEKYEGKVLLLLASDRPPHVNLLPGWRAVVRNLHTHYVDGHHRDLLDTRNVRNVADAIVSHLTTDGSLYPAA